MGDVVDLGVSGEAAEGLRISYVGSDNDTAVTGIRKAWRERGRVRGGDHVQ